MFDVNFHKRIEVLLSDKLGREILVSKVEPVAGGSINNAYCLTTNHGKYFFKANQANHYPNMFEKEANGLDLLRKTNTIKIPEVVGSDDFENTSFLILEWITSSTQHANFWKNFGDIY